MSKQQKKETASASKGTLAAAKSNAAEDTRTEIAPATEPHEESARTLAAEDPAARRSVELGGSASGAPSTAAPTSTADQAIVESAVVNDAVVKVALENLKAHPLSIAVYGPDCSDELVESVRENGILQPLLIAKKTDEIIAGNSRAEAARRAGMTEVPVIYFRTDDPLEIEAAVLDTNRQRIKTEEQKIREYREWRRIEAERAKRRLATNTSAEGMKKFSEADKGTARDKAAERIEKSGVTAEKGAEVVAAIDDLEKEGKKEEATELRTLLNAKSIEAAHKQARVRGYVAPKQARKAEGDGAKKSGADQSNDKAVVTKIVPKSNPEIDDAHGKALELGDNVLTFLKASGAKASAIQQADWEKLLRQLITCVKALGWSIA